MPFARVSARAAYQHGEASVSLKDPKYDTKRAVLQAEILLPAGGFMVFRTSPKEDLCLLRAVVQVPLHPFLSQFCPFFELCVYQIRC